MYLLSN